MRLADCLACVLAGGWVGLRHRLHRCHDHPCQPTVRVCEHGRPSKQSSCARARVQTQSCFGVLLLDYYTSLSRSAFANLQHCCGEDPMFAGLAAWTTTYSCTRSWWPQAVPGQRSTRGSFLGSWPPGHTVVLFLHSLEYCIGIALATQLGGC